MAALLAPIPQPNRKHVPLPPVPLLSIAWGHGAVGLPAAQPPAVAVACRHKHLPYRPLLQGQGLLVFLLMEPPKASNVILTLLIAIAS